MSINKAYLDELGNQSLKTDKVLFKMKNLFTKPDEDLDVIQIGIGGYSSSGKTVLIDAIFSLFSHISIPGYMPKTFRGGFFETEKFKGTYKDFTSLRAYVSNKFHTAHATADRGTWNENTYCAKLSFCGKERNILIRNLPGGMFKLFFEQSGNQNISIKSLFNEFIGSHEEYRKIYRDLYSFQLKEKANNTAAQIERKIIEIREAFIQSKLNDGAQERIQDIRENFFAFFFYMTSDYNIYCIKSNGRTETEIESDNENINRANRNSEDVGKFIICFTQFDRLMLGKVLPTNTFEITDETGKKSRLRRLWNWCLESIGMDTGTKKRDYDPDNELIRYWLSTNELYRDLYCDTPQYVNQTEWNEIRNFIGSTSYKWFFTTVAYNFSQRRFFEFQSQGSTATLAASNGSGGQSPVTGTALVSQPAGVWTILNNNQRTPVGVLELMLHIFIKSGLKMKDSDLPLPKRLEFNSVISKVND